MTARQRGAIAVLAAGVAGLMPGLAMAEMGFRLRAAGRTYQCGARVIEIAKNGGATLTVGDDPAVSSSAARWSTHGVTFTFEGEGSATLSEFGSTVSLKAAGGSTVCVTSR